MAGRDRTTGPYYGADLRRSRAANRYLHRWKLGPGVVVRPRRMSVGGAARDQADWSKRVDVAFGGGSGVSHKLYEKTPRKGLAENPRQRRRMASFLCQTGRVAL